MELQTENVLAANLAANYRYTLLIGPDNVSVSFGVIHSVLEVQVSRHLKRKIVKFEHNLIITTRWLQFESRKIAIMDEFTLRVIVVLLLGYREKRSNSGDFHYRDAGIK